MNLQGSQEGRNLEEAKMTQRDLAHRDPGREEEVEEVGEVVAEAVGVRCPQHLGMEEAAKVLERRNAPSAKWPKHNRTH